MSHVLDNPALASLTGPHAHFAERRGRVLRYPADVSPWLALPDDPGPDDWADLAALAGPGAEVPLAGYCGELPAGWDITFHVDGVQLVDDGIAAAPDPEAVRLGAADVPEMLDLVERTRPGPFLPRTVELGTYLGIRRDGALIAMAGERLHPPGWTEISAVCTDPAFRGEGLATRLILAVAHGIRERGETPFLHTGAGNTNAIRLYESLGFRLRRTTAFLAARPGSADAPWLPVPGQRDEKPAGQTEPTSLPAESAQPSGTGSIPSGATPTAAAATTPSPGASGTAPSRSAGSA